MTGEAGVDDGLNVTSPSTPRRVGARLHPEQSRVSRLAVLRVLPDPFAQRGAVAFRVQAVGGDLERQSDGLPVALQRLQLRRRTAAEQATNGDGRADQGSGLVTVDIFEGISKNASWMVKDDRIDHSHRFGGKINSAFQGISPLGNGDSAVKEGIWYAPSHTAYAQPTIPRRCNPTKRRML